MDSPFLISFRILLLDEAAHDVVGTEVAMNGPNIHIEPVMN